MDFASWSYIIALLLGTGSAAMLCYESITVMYLVNGPLGGRQGYILRFWLYFCICSAFVMKKKKKHYAPFVFLTA
jgi:hypothetical protein